MKISEITKEEVKKYLRITVDDDYDDKLVESMLEASKSFIIGYTGLDIKSLDKYKDVSLACLILCQDLYDNRSLYVDKNSINKTVDAILSMHSDNLVK